MNLPFIHLAVALATGVLIAVQSAWSGLAGRHLGAFDTSLLGLTVGGGMAAVVLVLKRGVTSGLPSPSLGYVVGIGVSSVVIGASLSFVVQRVGVTAGLASVVLGQFVAALVLDTLGWGAVTVQLEPRRVLGLLLLVAAVYCLAPRSP